MNLAFVVKVENFDEEWGKSIDCKCTECSFKFEQDSEEFDFDSEETFVTCPSCKHEGMLRLIGSAQK